jgi:hypothetical protein
VAIFVLPFGSKWGDAGGKGAREGQLPVIFLERLFSKNNFGFSYNFMPTSGHKIVRFLTNGKKFWDIKS